MTNCPECGGTVSERLGKCPHCGSTLKKSDRYSQFYAQPKPYQPEPQYIEVRHERSRPKKSSKSIALSVSAFVFSVMGFLLSFVAVMIAASRPKEVVVEKEVPVFKEEELEYYQKKSEIQETESNEKEIDSSNGEINYLASEPIFYTFTNSIGNMEYCFIQEVKNTGDLPLYLKGCDLNIEDKNGHLIATENFISSCPDIILSGETGYFYNSLGATMLNESAKTAESLKAVPSLNIVESRENPIEYEISDTSISKGTFDYPTVTGRITNNTKEDDSLVYINVIFYDSSGNIISITGVNVQDLTAGSTKGFECTALSSANFSYEDIGDYKVIARKSYYQF